MEALRVEALLYRFLIIPYIFWMLRQVIEHCVALPFVRYFKTDIHRRAHWSWVGMIPKQLMAEKNEHAIAQGVFESVKITNESLKTKVRVRGHVPE